MKLFTLLDFGAFLEIPRIVRKSLPHPAGVFFMLPNPPKMQYTATNQENVDSNDQINSNDFRFNYSLVLHKIFLADIKFSLMDWPLRVFPVLNFWSR